MRRATTTRRSGGRCLKVSNKDQLLMLLREVFGAEAVETEFRFHPKRMWRFDYAVPSHKIAVEYQGHGKMAGGSGHVGGHASVAGIAGDAEKFNTAQSMGWRVLLFTALHFREAERVKHKLSSVQGTLEELVAGSDGELLTTN